MKYSSIIKNDVVNGQGICVSFWVQGCQIHCPGCQNSSIWDFNGGKEFTYEVLQEIIKAISANGITRNLSILGGEPLCEENEFLTYTILSEVRKVYPNIKIYIWTGYLYEDLLQRGGHIPAIFELADVLIDGPYVAELRDITLPLRGSSNQRIIQLEKKE